MPDNIPEVKISRTAETILGVLGGIAGLIGAIFALLVGGLGTVFRAEGASTIVNLGWIAIFLSILGIVGGAIASRNADASGVCMLLSGVGGFLAISMSYIIAGPLLIIGGILALARKSKSKKSRN